MTALALVPGDASPVVVTLAMACRQVAFWERVWCEANADLVTHADGPERGAARARFDAADARLDAARNRRDRLIAESVGERWLWLAAADGEVIRG